KVESVLLIKACHRLRAYLVYILYAFWVEGVPKWENNLLLATFTAEWMNEVSVDKVHSESYQEVHEVSVEKVPPLLSISCRELVTTVINRKRAAVQACIFLKKIQQMIYYPRYIESEMYYNFQMEHHKGTWHLIAYGRNIVPHFYAICFKDLTANGCGLLMGKHISVAVHQIQLLLGGEFKTTGIQKLVFSPLGLQNGEVQPRSYLYIYEQKPKGLLLLLNHKKNLIDREREFFSLMGTKHTAQSPSFYRLTIYIVCRKKKSMKLSSGGLY
ncbi:hypothetical protein ACJX0J_005638, partial [Zea mays]